MSTTNWYKNSDISFEAKILTNELLKAKKTKYVIFSRTRNVELPMPLIISNTAIERKTEARFLGVIIDETLNWTRHVKTVLSKMSRYVGIMYKIKSFYHLKHGFRFTIVSYNHI